MNRLAWIMMAIGVLLCLVSPIIADFLDDDRMESRIFAVGWLLTLPGVILFVIG